MSFNSSFSTSSWINSRIPVHCKLAKVEHLSKVSLKSKNGSNRSFTGLTLEICPSAIFWADRTEMSKKVQFTMNGKNSLAK